MSTNQDYLNSEIPSHRACAHCRSQKVRCIPDDSNPDICQRCARSGRPCVFTPLQKRKQRKRTDTRVAELEREMRMMRSMLKEKNKQQQATSSTAEASLALEQQQQQPVGLWYAENVPNAPRTEDRGLIFPPTNNPSQSLARPSEPIRGMSRPRVDLGKDVIDRDILSMATAREMFETYRKDLYPHYPMVAIPDSVTADEMRQTKPILFLAVISAASGKDQPEISAVLDQEVLQAYAQRSLVQSEKSLELVQALLISAVWYHPPNRFGQLKYYEYVHMAASMAVDIGIGSRPVSQRSRFGDRSSNNSGRPSPIHPLEDVTNPDLSMTPRSRASSPEIGSIESRRTFVACYTICTAVAISLRRPNMLRHTSYVKECVDYIDRSPQAMPSDRLLMAWARLVMIADDIGTSFSYDDPGGIACITELQTQLMLKDFTKKLDNWYTSVPEIDMNGALKIVYWTTRLYVYEIGLHVDHSPEDFKAPYQMGMVQPWDGDEIPTQILAETVAECISSSQNLIDTFLAMDIESCRALPVLIFVRVSFAAFIIAKLCLSANHPGSQIARVLDRSSLKAESVLDRAILHVRAIIGPTRCRVPAIFLALLFKLRQWCLNPKLIEPPQESILDPAMRDAKVPSKPPTREQSPLAVEQDDSADNSPQSQEEDESQGGSYEDTDTGNVHTYSTKAAQMPPNLTPESQQFDYVPTMLSSEVPMTTFDAESTAPPVSAFLNTEDQMHLDENFFQFFDNMNAMGGPDLMGMNDWASIPTDLLGLPGNFNWQSMPIVDPSEMQ